MSLSSTIQSSTNRQFWAPAAADPSAVTPSGTAWAASAWVEVLATASDDSCLTAISVATMGTTTGDTRLEVEVGVGGAGSEVRIATMPMSGGVNNGFWQVGCPRWTIPVDKIPAGSRVAVRMRKSGTDTTTWSFAVGYVKKPITGGAIPMLVSTQAPYVFPAAAEPVTTTPSGGSSAVFANGAWTTVMASPPSDAVLLGYNVTWGGNGYVHEIDFAVGPAGAESIVYVAKVANISIPGGPSFQELVCPLDVIRAAVRVSARSRQSLINSTTGRGIKLLLMDKPL